MHNKETTLYYDRTTNQYFRANPKQIEAVEKKIADVLNAKEFISLRQVYDILTSTWPEDKRIEFFKHLDKHEGWDRGFAMDRKKERFEYKQFKYDTHVKDGENYIELIFSIKEKP